LLIFVLAILLFFSSIFYLFFQAFGKRKTEGEEAPGSEFIQLIEGNAVEGDLIKIIGLISKSLFIEDDFYKLEITPKHTKRNSLKVFLLPAEAGSLPITTIKEERPLSSQSVPIEEAEEKLYIGREIEIEVLIYKKEFYNTNSCNEKCQEMLPLYELFEEKWNLYNEKNKSLEEIGFTRVIRIFE